MVRNGVIIDENGYMMAHYNRNYGKGIPANVDATGYFSETR